MHRTRQRAGIGGWVLILLLGQTPGCGTDLGEQARPGGNARMAAMLDSVVAASDPASNIFLNEARVRLERGRLARAGGRGNTGALRFNLGMELLLAGQTPSAIEEFARVRTELERRGDPVSRERLRELGTWLGIAHLRLGEQENCLLAHTSESCLFPIRPSGVHKLQRGSRAAIAEYESALERDPDDLSSRWLLNIAYMTIGAYPDKVPERWLIAPRYFAADYDIKRFRDLAPRLGLDVVALSGGSIMEDFDNDGYLDIMASSWGLRDQLRYFRNGGDGSFSDRTAAAGLEGQIGGLNLFHADYDNDGYRDVLVPRGAWMHDQGLHPNSLLRNQGDGTFADVTEAAGLLSFHPTHAVAWGDYDNDGWLDLFVGNESDDVDAHPCQLYRNQGDGTFAEVAAEVGVDHVAYVKGVAWGDYDNDGLQDLYISCRGKDNVLYRNQGKTSKGWRFADVTAAAGVERPLKSFPTWFWDFDNDGWLDLFAGSFHVETPGDIAAVFMGLPSGAEPSRLYRNQGDGTFADVTREVGLDRIILAMGANFGDLDNDGFPDCYIGTGEPDLRSLMPNLMYRNAEGRSFQDVTASGGFGHLQKGHGISFGDVDNDGDQDIFEVMGGAYTGDVYQNVLFENPGHGNHWITLRLEGVRSNRDAIGARVRVRVRSADGVRDVHSTVSTGGSFGASSLQQEIGLGQARRIEFVEVTWPATGAVQVFEEVAMDQVLRIREGDAAPSPLPLQRFVLASTALPRHP